MIQLSNNKHICCCINIKKLINKKFNKDDAAHWYVRHHRIFSRENRFRQTHIVIKQHGYDNNQTILRTSLSAILSIHRIRFEQTSAVELASIGSNNVWCAANNWRSKIRTRNLRGFAYLFLVLKQNNNTKI